MAAPHQSWPFRFRPFAAVRSWAIYRYAYRVAANSRKITRLYGMVSASMDVTPSFVTSGLTRTG